MATDQEYWKKRASEEEQMAQLQEHLKGIRDTLAYHEKEREQSMRFYDKQRDAEMWAQVIEKAKLDTDPLSAETLQEVQADIQSWHEGRAKFIESYAKSDGTSEIPRGTFTGFDEKAAAIIEKGNVYTSLPFIAHAQKLAAQQAEAFENKQEEYSKRIDSLRQQGDTNQATVLEARKVYEAAAYERDTSESVLAKYKYLYGVESHHYKEQEAAVQRLNQDAENLYAKLETVTSIDAQMRESLQSETLMLEHLPIIMPPPDVVEQATIAQQENEIVIENPEAVEVETVSADQESETDNVVHAEMPTDVELEPSMMDRLHDRIVERQEDDAFAQGWAEFQASDGGPPTTEAEEAEARADDAIRAMDEGHASFDDGWDEFEAQEAAAEDALEREMSGETVDDHDSDGDAQIAEDRHFAAEMPQDLDFEAPEDHDREYEMAPVHRHEEQDSQKSQASAEVSTAALTQEFSESDRDRLDQMKERSNLAMENMAKASDTGDDRALHAARKELSAANSEFQDYLSDRREFKTAMAEFGNAADRLTKNGGELDSAEARKFERTYKEANSAIDRMETDSKPWAGEMRQHLRAVGETHVEKEKASKNDDEPRSSSMSTIMRKSDSDRETQREARIVEYTPPPVQTQQDQDKDRQVQH